MPSPRTRPARTTVRVLLVAVLATALLGGMGWSTAGAAAPEWHIARINGPSTAPGVVIAVVDSGIDRDHPVFAGRLLPTIDYVDDGETGDPNGHGTHVAGTAAGADAGCGNIGVAPDATILPIRVLDADGSGSGNDVADAIRVAADAGAAVINLSLGSDVVLRNLAGSGLEDAIAYAFAKGSIPVLAAGNDGFIGDLFGSGYRNIDAVVVTATTNEDRAASYATPIGSAKWGVSAPGGAATGEPGEDIQSAFPGGGCALSAGTSMAAPAVSGALAALRARGFSAQAAVDRLLATARDLGSADTYGAGLIDVAAATSQSPAPTTQPPATQPPVTEPPATQPTQPPATQPPATQPPATQPPATQPQGSQPAGSQAPAGESVDPDSSPPSVDGSATTAASGPDAGVPGDDTGERDGAAGPSTTSDGDGPIAESAAAVVVDEDDDGMPAGLVAAAVVGLAGVGAGAFALRRRLV